jgi:phosphatidylglycerophosphatase A
MNPGTPRVPPLRRLTLLVATGFGLGYAPIASGTFGTLPGVLLVALLWPRLPWPVQAVLAVLLALAAIPACDVAERHFRRKDDGRIVADEYLAFPLSTIGLSQAALSPAWLLVPFLTFRFFDIVKPPPARGLQRLPGGTGIVIDDVIAALYALAVNHLVFAMLSMAP